MRHTLLALTALFTVCTLVACGDSKSASIIGVWEAELEMDEGRAIIGYVFDDDGTCSMYGNLGDEEKEMTGIKWTRNGDSIYVYSSSKEARGEVLILRIMSLDEKSLVLWPDGEPKRDISYLTRKETRTISSPQLKAQEKAIDSAAIVEQYLKAHGMTIKSLSDTIDQQWLDSFLSEHAASGIVN